MATVEALNGSSTVVGAQPFGHATSHWVQLLDDSFSAGDPEVRQWFLVRQTLLPFALCLSYALFATRLGPALMRDRPPFDLRHAMVVFNGAVVLAYTVSTVAAVYYLSKASWHDFCYGASVLPGKYTHPLVSAMWVIYVLKYVEFLDTVFFVLRKKQNLISTLHVVHHSIVPIVAWVLMRMETSGLQFIPCLMNSVVHIVMYSYYCLAAMGPGVRKYLWWKKYLTQLQMVQFIAMFLYVTLFASFSGCQKKMNTCFMCLFLSPFFLFLFYRYYRSTFKSKKQ